MDPKTCNKKGEFRVIFFEKDRLCFDNLTGELKEGAILQNTAFAAAINIKNCNTRNTRARAFILQTENIEISDCEFYGMSLHAIQTTPDVIRWYEVGPVKNMNIYNNTFTKCGFVNNDCPVITVQDNHDKREGGGLPGVHKNIEITENVFKDKSGRCIFVTSTDGVKINDNRFQNCKTSDNFIDCPMCEDAEISD